MNRLQYSDGQRESVLSRAVEVLSSGRAIVFPSDTVYALLAAVDCPEAYREIFQLKQRDAAQPLQLLASPDHPSVSEVVRLLEDFEEEQDAFLCGKLTAVFPGGAVKRIPVDVGSIQPGSVGIRLPSWEPLSELCRLCGGLLWGTSANISGTSPATTEEQMLDSLAGMSSEPALTITIPSALPGMVSDVVRFGPDGPEKLR